MFGPGIYFAENPSDAKRKARPSNVQPGNGMVIRAHVWIGWVLVVPGARNSLTKEEVYSYGCHSVIGRATGDEYVV
jgi:hypothetical protein